MDRIKVESTNIKSIGYNEVKVILEIEFLNGSIYNYFKVKPKTFKEIMKAESKGKYFHKNIREKYEYLRVN